MAVTGVLLLSPWPGRPLWRARLKALMMKLLVPWGAQAGTALLSCRYVKDGTLGGTGLVSCVLNAPGVTHTLCPRGLNCLSRPEPETPTSP